MAWWLLLAPLSIWLLILILYARPIRAAWREPALRYPVLIIESDDWGPGPRSHAQSLHRLIEMLEGYRDVSGRKPVMTLGLTLTLADGEAIAASGYSTYYARPITDPAYQDILVVIKAGIQAGVFAPQLHGMAHYWPATLLNSAVSDPAVLQWLSGSPGLETEALPGALQSRWIDVSVLPSRPLPDSAIHAAVAEETVLYRSVFEALPLVAVPPTFIWTDTVETAWANHGVACIITPGRRCFGRDGNGRPICEPFPVHNGQRGGGGVLYLVRDRYFEPARGHRGEQGLAALAEKTAQGRPCLLETHRFNFTGLGQENSLDQLSQLLELALARHPNLRFTSSAELAQQYRTNGDWLVTNRKQRFAIWTTRLLGIPRFAKLARLTGFGLFLSALAVFCGAAPLCLPRVSQ